MPALLAGLLLAAWLVARLAWPGLGLRVAPILHLAWSVLLPLALLALLAYQALPLGLAAGLLTAVVLSAGRRRPGYLRRRTVAEAAACTEGLRAAGQPAEMGDVAACVLLERFARRGMARAEVAIRAGRCRTVDDLAAQVALVEGGLSRYAAYLRRYGLAGEVAEAAATVHGDRFPGGPGAGR